MTDAILQVTNNIYDISIDSEGDIAHADFFDTSLLYSIFGERRASPDEMAQPERRRGWIGNDANFENGSKLWLFEQARLTASNLRRIENEVENALEWLVEDGYAVSIDDVIATPRSGNVQIEVVIRRSRDQVERRLYNLWENTGNAN